MTKPSLWLDAYERRARLSPGLIALLPVVVVLAALGWRDLKVVTAVGSVLVTAGGPVLLAGYVRHLGLSVEKRLVTRWGGMPTTRFLRMHGTEVSAPERDAWRAAVERITGTTLPTSQPERRNPAQSDGKYEVAIARLRQLMRQQDDSGLIIGENANYGFQRNLLGIRPLGLATSGVGVVVVGVGFLVSSASRASLGIGAAICVAFLVVWLFVPSKARVKMAADKYARQLLNSAMTTRLEAER